MAARTYYYHVPSNTSNTGCALPEYVPHHIQPIFPRRRTGLSSYRVLQHPNILTKGTQPKFQGMRATKPGGLRRMLVLLIPLN